MQTRHAIPDRVIMYASHFSYNPGERNKFIFYKLNEDKIRQYQGSNMLPNGSLEIIQGYLAADEHKQRENLDSKKYLKDLLRVLFEIVKNVRGDPDLLYFALVLINAVFEDGRIRIRELVFMQKSANENTKVDAVQILYSFLLQHTAKTAEALHMRDLASHTLALLITSYEASNCRETARNFLNFVLDSQKGAHKMLSERCHSNCLMFLVKQNELAEMFVEKRGFVVLRNLLTSECLSNEHIAYNVLTTLWILSYHEFSLPYLADYALNIIELVTKVLDYFNKEKIVRIVCMLFENLKRDPECMECLSMVNVLNIVTKLQNRPWVDKDITDCLERLFKFFDQNYHEYSTFEKWKKQITKGQLSWSPVHTEKFWQSAFVYFHEADNLACIRILIDIVGSQPEPGNDDKQAFETKQAVALYDIGEFSRFFPLGRSFLERHGAKERIAGIMADPYASPELKKEAITCYQKVLMKSWGQGGQN